MNQSPRQKRLTLLLFLAAFAFALFSVNISAQPQRGRSSGAPRRSSAQKTDAASKAAAAQQRQQEERQRQKARRMEAIALLNEAAASARLFDDLFYRARVQAQVADALWDVDERSARTIFRRAWEAAAVSDKAEREAAANQIGAASVSSQPLITEARDEVLLKAAARDAGLAEAFLKELTKEMAEGQSNAQKQPASRSPWRELSGMDAERLAYAFELLGQGESNSAAQLASPLVSRGVSADLITFIIRLREQNAVAADRLYKQLLIQARTDASADANSILLLSSPMISSGRLLVVDERGSLQFRPLPRNFAEAPEQPPVAPDLRQVFYQTIAQLLLRPATSRAVEAGQTQQAFALYIALGRLLPFFEREAAQYAPELRARESALAGELEAGRREQLAAHFDSRRAVGEDLGGDPLRASYEQLARANGAQERDPILIRIVRAAVRHRLWDRARRAATELDNQDTRRAALSFIAVSQISDLARTYADDKEYDYESIIKFLNGADVPPLAHAWGLTEAALVAARHGEDARPALIILDEAERYAGRTEARTKERVAAYAIIASAAARLEEQRAWRLLAEVVRAANAVDGFTGDEMTLDIGATAAAEQALPAVADTFSVKSEAFRFDQIFATMARLDMIKTVAEARTLEGRVPQSFAYIAIARAVLDNKKG